MKHSKRTPQHGRVYRVRSADGGWVVFDQDERSVSERMRTQADAVAHAKELARRDGSAQIIVYDAHGDVASEFFYQREERPALAYDDSARTTAASHAATAGAVGPGPRRAGGRDPRGGR